MSGELNNFADRGGIVRDESLFIREVTGFAFDESLQAVKRR
jgi:hypothetical protein